MSAKRLYSIGAALRQETSAEPKVLGAVNSESLVEHVKNKGISMLEGEGQITGFNGLILGIAKERGLDATCILGEIDNPNLIQPKAVQSILKVLLDMLGIKPFNMKELDEEEDKKNGLQDQFSYPERAIEHSDQPGIA